MNKPFAVSTNQLSAQPNTEKLIFRSDNAADTGNLTLTGSVSSSPTAETLALTGEKEKQTANTYASLTSAILSAAQTGNVSVFSSATGLAGNGYFQYTALPANNDTLIIGLTGSTRTYAYKSSLTGSSNEIKIAATVAAQATNLYEALNAGANAGTDYGTGTAAHADLLGVAPTGANVPCSDRLAVSRQIAWTFTQTGTAHTMQIPIGGVTGTLIAYIAIGATQLFNALTLSTEDLSTNTLPGKVTPTTNSIVVNGKACALRFKGNPGSAIALKYQTSTDNINWANGAASITSIANTMTVLAPQFVIPTEQNIEYIRLVITGNSNVDVPLDARVIFPQV